MESDGYNRRDFLELAGAGLSQPKRPLPGVGDKARRQQGAQRLTIGKLHGWESLRYGMFIHFGIGTYPEPVTPASQPDAAIFAPELLDVSQWISVARDAGMRYAVLTAKHISGHCLWPSKHTDYTVAKSTNRADVVGAFVRACEKCGVMPGLYYCSEDYHHRFGSVCPEEPGGPYTTSAYQTFQTAQITELLTQYGRIMEVWIDIPGTLGRGYRTFLYRHIAKLQPDAFIMMNSGDFTSGEHYNIDYAWPSDLIAIERNLPPAPGHQAWRTIDGKEYYLPGEVCDPIGKEWFYRPGDLPRPDAELLSQFNACRERGVNLLLNVPPDTHGLIPKESVDALMRLRAAATL